MKHYDMLVIGAGMSGLSMAHQCLQKGLKIAILEKTNRVGGTFHSHRFTDDFWVELGAHTTFNSYGNILKMMEDCQLLNETRKREKVSFRMWVNNAVKSIPSQLHFIELLLSAYRLFTLKKEGQTVQSYYEKIVGKRNYKAVFGHAFNAVICQQANDVPADMLFRKKPRRKDVLRSFTFDNGLQTITDHVAQQADLTTFTEQDIQSITFDNHIFTVKTQTETFTASHLTLATPADVTAKLLQPTFPEISQSLEKIKIVSVETVAIMVDKDVVKLPPVMGLIAKDDQFFSMVARDTVKHPKYRGFVFHFKSLGLSHDEKIQQICKVLNITESQIIDKVEKLNVLPSPVLGHHALIEKVDNLLLDQPLALTGNYFLGISAEDCASRSDSEFQRLYKN